MTTEQSSSNVQKSSTTSASDFDEEWEEWDGRSPFWVHCVAGSLAGVAEHTLVYPLDTVRTHIQVCAACHYNGSNSTSAAAKSARVVLNGGAVSVLQKAAAGGGNNAPQAAAGSGGRRPHLTMLQAIRQLVSQPLALESAGTASAALGGAPSSAAAAATTTVPSAAGMSRLFRGVQSVMVGCVPAHALYFSSYEVVKAATLDRHGNVTTYGSALAGAAAVVSHDLILAPLDTVKQRLQLGHYRGLGHALATMIRNEGVVSLFRSFPITLATNIPYGMVMVGTNEFCKQQWTDSGAGEGEPHRALTVPVTMAAGGLAGLVASAATTPLDRIKTYLQTQQLSPACMLSPQSSHHPESCPLQQSTGGSKPIVADWRQAARRIYQTEGAAGFFRGLAPRILSHTPAVAISWTTYEAAKRYLQRTFVED